MRQPRQCQAASKRLLSSVKPEGNYQVSLHPRDLQRAQEQVGVLLKQFPGYCFLSTPIYSFVMIMNSDGGGAGPWAMTASGPAVLSD